jgi:hypothetical protein
MISCPQGDLRHTGHVGVDGAFFGDVPRQVLPAGRTITNSVADGHANRDRGDGVGVGSISLNGTEDSLSALGAVGGGYPSGDPPSTPASPLDGGVSLGVAGRPLARAPSDLSSDRAPLLTPRTPVDGKSGPSGSLGNTRLHHHPISQLIQLYSLSVQNAIHQIVAWTLWLNLTQV